MQAAAHNGFIRPAPADRATSDRRHREQRVRRQQHGGAVPSASRMQLRVSVVSKAAQARITAGPLTQHPVRHDSSVRPFLAHCWRKSNRCAPRCHYRRTQRAELWQPPPDSGASWLDTGAGECPRRPVLPRCPGMSGPREDETASWAPRRARVGAGLKAFR